MTTDQTVDSFQIEAARIYFRPAGPPDVEGIKALIQSSSVHSRSRRPGAGHPGGHPRRRLFSRLFSPLYSSGVDWSGFVVAQTAEGELIACARIRRHRGGVREIATVSLLKAWRGRGLPRAGFRFIQGRYPGDLWGTCLTSYLPLYNRLGAVDMSDSRRVPACFRWRLCAFNLLLRLLGSRRRLAVIVFRPPDPAKPAG